MKKSVVVIFAVAIIGALGVYGKSRNNTAASLASSNSTSLATTSSSQQSSTAYKDGTYTGASEDTPYGTVQIAVVISGGKITGVDFLQMPSDLGHSQEITAAVEPLLKQITLQKQSANIDFVSGATSTSSGYQQSLQAALNQAALS